MSRRSNKVRRPQAPKRHVRQRAVEKEARLIEQSMYLPPSRQRFVR